jgi:uncharacterized glyoxalase superfamily protein PhnB
MSITPYLFYQDVAGALKFLAKAFGFRKYGVQMRRPDGKINHAAMKFGDDLIMMNSIGRLKQGKPVEASKTLVDRRNLASLFSILENAPIIARMAKTG